MKIITYFDGICGFFIIIDFFSINALFLPKNNYYTSKKLFVFVPFWLAMQSYSKNDIKKCHLKMELNILSIRWPIPPVLRWFWISWTIVTLSSPISTTCRWRLVCIQFKCFKTWSSQAALIIRQLCDFRFCVDYA